MDAADALNPIYWVGFQESNQYNLAFFLRTWIFAIKFLSLHHFLYIFFYYLKNLSMQKTGLLKCNIRKSIFYKLVDIFSIFSRVSLMLFLYDVMFSRFNIVVSNNGWKCLFIIFFIGNRFLILCKIILEHFISFPHKNFSTLTFF